MPTNTNAQELELVPAESAEPVMKQLVPFDGFREKVEKLKATAETLTVTDASDRAGMSLARTTRLALKEVRVAITHRHKELKENILVEGRKIDAGKNELLALIEPLESRLEEQEKFIERETARIAEEKRTARAAELSPYLSAPVAVDLGTMTDEAYASMLQDAKDAQAARIAREKREREEAEAKAKAEAEERERIRLENERLKKEAESAAAEKARLDKQLADERKAAEERARKEREAAEAVLAKEREEAARLAREAKAKADAEAKKLRDEAAERERVAAEAARKEREAIEAKAKAEREARQKAEAELAAKKAAEEKAAADKAAAEKAAAMAPEKEKLNTFAGHVRLLVLPALKDKSVEKEIAEGVERFAVWVEKKAAAL